MIDRFVLDCSVAAKWYLLDEEGVDDAELILTQLLDGEIELHAPEFLKYELGNALTKAQRTKGRGHSNDQSGNAYQTFSSLPIRFHQQDSPSLQEALLFANQFQRSFYDSCYLVLAVRLGCPWLTAEKKFRGPFPIGFPRNLIHILGSPTKSV